MPDDDEQLEELRSKPARETADGQNIAELWRKFRERGDQEARNALTEFFFDMVRAHNENIGTILLQAVEDNDLYQAGVVGFMEAINNYDPARGVSFEEYGSLAIRRAIMEEIRSIVSGEDAQYDRDDL